jgi:hypothetical protein
VEVIHQRNSKMSGEYYIDLFDDDQMISVFPDCEKYGKIFGRIGAKWEKEEKGWIFPNKYEGFVRKVIKRVVKEEDQNEGVSSLISSETSRKHRSRSDDEESSAVSEDEDVNKRLAPSRKSPSRKSPSRKSPSRKSPSRKSPSRKSPSRKKRPRRSPSRRPRHDSSDSEAAGETNNEENVDINQMILEKLESMEKRIRKLEEQ